MTLGETDVYLFNRVTFLVEKSRKVATLNATFLSSHFFVQPGRLLHVSIDGFPQNYRAKCQQRSIFLNN